LREGEWLPTLKYSPRAVQKRLNRSSVEMPFGMKTREGPRNYYVRSPDDKGTFKGQSVL